jgi:PEP-CTERM motif
MDRSKRISTLACLTLCVGALLVLGGPAQAASYFLWDDWGGTWADAEKDNLAGDDLLCWAAAASNVLEWTGWGLTDGLTNADEIFEVFEDHWTDLGGSPWFAWDWWFDGTNDKQGEATWSQEDVDGAGGYFLGENVDVFRIWDGDDADIMANVDAWLHDGYGLSFWIGGGGAHLITCWGYDYDPTNGDYLGVWVTDSDDDKNGGHPRPNVLAYYDVSFVGGQWTMPDYGNGTWYIGEVMGLLPRPIPEPGTLALLGLGLLGIAGYRIRRRR